MTKAAKALHNRGAGYRDGFISGQKDAKVWIGDLQSERDKAIAEAREAREQLAELTGIFTDFHYAASKWCIRHD
jgi:hypothetical protein